MLLWVIKHMTCFSVPVIKINLLSARPNAENT
uniref:Uncharacterized protein n=1 Tax=Anguilla anguilla TaxID=7936 RepID=A0A0E9Q231_ANGAN